MKILLVHNFYRSGTPGGEDVVFEQEKRLLESAGHEIAVYTRSNDEMNERNPLDVLRTILSMRRSRRTVRELGRMLREHRPHVVHVHNTFPLISASAYEACVAHRVPIVQTVHNYRHTCPIGIHYRAGAVCESCIPGNPWAAAKNRCYRGSWFGSVLVAAVTHYQTQLPVSKLVDRFLVLGKFAARRLEEAGVDPARIVIKSNFVSDEFQHFESAADDVQSEPYVFFSGRLTEEKGLRTVLKAWRALPDVALKIAGEGPLAEELRQRAQTENLRIEFLGMQSREQVIRLAARARLQLVASEWFEAGVPLVALEAWAMGTPVLASRLGGLTDAEASMSFEAGNPHDLAEKVRAIWADDALAARLSMEARARFQSIGTAQRSLSILENTYRELLDLRDAA